jgi:antitoxin ParD1/3/4
MASMNVLLPAPMKGWVEMQIDSGKYASSSDYVRDLIRRDQERREKLTALRGAITQGLESGVSEKTLDELWLGMKARHGLDV